MNRRGFLGAMLAAAVAPAIVRADSLMRIIPRDTTVHYWDVTCEPSREITLAGDLYGGEIGSWEGMTIHESPLLTRANVAALIKVMKEREIKPAASGAYWLRVTSDDWIQLIDDSASQQFSALRGSPLLRR